MASLQQYDSLYDLIILGLVLIILYYWLKNKSSSSFKTRKHKVDTLRKEKSLDETRRLAKFQLNSLLETKSRLKKEAAAAKRNYMKGEISYDEMKQIVENAQEQLIGIEGALKDYDWVY